MLSRELSLYLEHQVRVGFFGSGVGLSLILGFSVAYACYYLSSIAKGRGLLGREREQLTRREAARAGEAASCSRATAPTPAARAPTRPPADGGSGPGGPRSAARTLLTSALRRCPVTDREAGSVFGNAKPQLVTGGESFSRFLQDHCPVVTETYYPTVWCWESRGQTLLRPFITSKPPVQYRNELIKTADGGQISLDWFDNDNSTCYMDASTRPTILLLPGLTGTSKESYILHMIHLSEELGYRYQ
ncbi:Phospholipase abhd3 [Saguinus oedipus]|uniref:Phospholipase abhd3 n=1 Tax=Saguinus oedipus TaxID=9490 RepID=A0ABQ9UBV7_SAGOE|nr:Phospholipase abhd3 [Saguinus oedipus]